MTYPLLFRPESTPAKRPLPLYSHVVRAGFPSPADDYVSDTLDLNEHLISHQDATFFLRVRGHSMIGAGIQDGDLNRLSVDELSVLFSKIPVNEIWGVGPNISRRFPLAILISSWR